jgi:hypothetical protein
VGLFNDLAAKASETALPDGAPVQPNPANRAIYDRLVDKYIALEDTLYHYFRP